MSNAAVGNVYDAIISEVINAVRVDFEENGVDDGALDDLKKVRLARSLCLSLSPSTVCPYRPPALHLAARRLPAINRADDVIFTTPPSGCSRPDARLIWGEGAR